jgi:hypothetical protein
MTEFAVTRFDDSKAQSMIISEMTLDELAELVRSGPVAATKDDLPMVKLGRFGSRRSAANCLRSDANLTSLSGIIADYDGETMSVQEAADRLAATGILFLIYTSPSYRPTAPRWRVACPFSKDHPKTDHTRMLNRVNGVLGGALAPESWSAAQGYYFGSVSVGPPVEVVVDSDGEQCLDEAEELDQTAMPKPATTASGGKIDLDGLDENELLELIQAGKPITAQPAD